MNIEEEAKTETPAVIDPSIQLIQGFVQDKFRMLLKYQFIQEVYEEVMSQNPGELDDHKLETIVGRLFEILIAERIENLVDVEKQESIQVRIYSTELDAGFLVSDNMFKIISVVNISQVKENSKKNTENGCLKFTLSNGKEQVSGIEEGKLVDLPSDLDLNLIEGFLIYVGKDTVVRRGIMMLSGLTSFVFDSMGKFQKGVEQLMQRVEKYHRDQELLNLQRQQRERQLQQEQDRLRERENQRERESQMNMETTQGTRPQVTQRQEEELKDEFAEYAEFFDDDSNNMQAAETFQAQRVAANNNHNNNQQMNNNNYQNQMQNQNQFNREEPPAEPELHSNHEMNMNSNPNPITAEECNELLNLLYDDDD